MTDKHHLENKMRVLKLNGMVDTLELRLGQAQKDGLGFTQFLEILLEDEIQQRANKRLAHVLSVPTLMKRKISKGLISLSIPNYPPSTSVNWPPASLSSVRNP
jgi:hypothetical protein